MKITLYTTRFYPQVGGIETVVQLLATAFHKLGHQVTVVTSGLSDTPDEFPFGVLRRPSIRERLLLNRSSDFILHNSISLKFVFWELFFCQKVFVTHHTWYPREGLKNRLLSGVKIMVTALFHNIYISRAIGKNVGLNGVVINNPYDDSRFVYSEAKSRSKDLVFLGRLVSDKGCDLLIDALSILRADAVHPGLTIIGSGDEEPNLKEKVALAGLEDQVDFKGVMVKEELSKELGRHKIMVIPSRWDEPYGVVALEGLASGCRVIGSTGGGLQEALDRFGHVFESGNAADLARKIMICHDQVGAFEQIDDLRKYLEKRSARFVALEYLNYFAREKEPDDQRT